MKRVLCGLLLLLTACSELPPKNPDNLCAIFQEKSAWYEDSKQAAQRWSVPVPVLMAIMAQESSFVSDAKPPRTWLLGFIPWTRPSSAYGYAQAVDGTWELYQNKAASFGADRDDFSDAVDFIAWYNHISHKQLGIALHDVKNLYLAYYEGLEGYARKSYANNARLVKTAAEVARRAKLFQNQLSNCQIN
jgi:hypothetical protein